MRILLAHNRYRYRGGEDSVFEAERQLLRDNGHKVFEFTKSNEGIDDNGSIPVAINAIWATDSYREMCRHIRDLRPHIVHVHNYFPMISPAIFFAAHAERVPAVQTLHNYRYACPGGMLMRNGIICEECVAKRFKWPGIRHGCYRDSALASATVASMLSLHGILGTWKNKVTRFIALTKFQQSKLASAGLPSNKIVVKPNFCPDSGYLKETSQAAEGGIFVGRLSYEKGVDVLVDAVRNCNVPVDLVGSGPKLDEISAAAPTNLRVHGYKDGAELAQLKRNALFCILPSIVYEGFPMVIPEMFAMGVPVIASRHGGMREIVEDGRTGLHFNPGDANDLSSKIRWASENADKMRIMGQNARKVYEENFTPAQNHKRLLEIYENAIREES